MMLSKDELKSYVERAYAAACSHGFFDASVPTGIMHLAMLVISEVGEAVNADRLSLRADLSSLKLSSADIPFVERYAAFVGGSVEDELADVALRMFSMCGYYHVMPSSLTASAEDASRCTQEMLSLSDGDFCTRCFILCSVLCKLDRLDEEEALRMLPHVAGALLYYLFAMCDDMGIDLRCFIDLKMAFNETRPSERYGKSY